MLEPVHAFCKSLFKGILSIVALVNELNIGWIQVFIDSLSRCNAYFFLCTSAVELRFCFVAQMNADSIALCDDLFSID